MFIGKINKLINEVNKLIDQLETEAILGPISNLELCLEELLEAKDEIKFYDSDSENEDDDD